MLQALLQYNCQGRLILRWISASITCEVQNSGWRKTLLFDGYCWCVRIIASYCIMCILSTWMQRKANYRTTMCPDIFNISFSVVAGSASHAHNNIWKQPRCPCVCNVWCFFSMALNGCFWFHPISLMEATAFPWWWSGASFDFMFTFWTTSTAWIQQKSPGGGRTVVEKNTILEHRCWEENKQRRNPLINLDSHLRNFLSHFSREVKT